MFRRLEAFVNDTSAASAATAGASHLDYLQDQNKYFQTIQNVIPSATTGLRGFSDAIQSVNTTGQATDPTAVPYADDIFRQEISPALAERAKVCATSSMDQLLMLNGSGKGADANGVGCGWLYTPPTKDSPQPQLSQGFLGMASGPIRALKPPEYKRWFFDLQLAKKQIMLDRCKALKACTDVDSEAFKGMCGYCTDTNQGVPIDNVGKALYPTEPLGGCSSDAIVTTGARCPPPVDLGGTGPQPAQDRTCEPVNGRLSTACLHRNVLQAGCADTGSLAIALATANDPNDYVSGIRNSDAVKQYQRTANPPLNLDLFRQGQATVEEVLREVRQLAGNKILSATSGLGSAARDLCVQKGAVASYDMCSDLADGSTGPFEMVCLQRLFLKMGGQPKGSLYPSTANMAWYNSLGTYGAVKQAMQQAMGNMSNANYDTQRSAMTQFLGITPEQGVARAPYAQGVEVFWFIPTPGNPRRVNGFLRRTIERDIVRLNAGPSRVAQIGGGAFGCMLQLTDIRAPADFSARFGVTVDDGFWIAVNQPARIDHKAMTQYAEDTPGFFENLGLQGPTLYQSKECTPFKAATPNVTKMFFEDAGGGWHSFQFNAWSCAGPSAFNAPSYSLTCEARAPFLTYEVGTGEGGAQFEELRNPGLFRMFLGLDGLEYHVRPEEREAVPGRKGFVRVNNVSSLIDMYNIAFQSWKTMTIAIRLQSMPIKETLVKLAMGAGYLSIIATPVNGSQTRLSVEHTLMGGVQTMDLPTVFPLTTWILIGIQNTGTAFDLFTQTVEGLIQSKGGVTMTHVNGRGQLYSPNGTWAPAPGQPREACTVMMGSNRFLGRADWPGMYATSSFQYDLAWIHFFSQYTTNDDVYRECMANWVYTMFPSSYGVYKGA